MLPDHYKTLRIKRSADTKTMLAICKAMRDCRTLYQPAILAPTAEREAAELKYHGELTAYYFLGDPVLRGSYHASVDTADRKGQRRQRDSATADKDQTADTEMSKDGTGYTRIPACSHGKPSAHPVCLRALKDTLEGACQEMEELKETAKHFDENFTEAETSIDRADQTDPMELTASSAVMGKTGGGAFSSSPLKTIAGWLNRLASGSDLPDLNATRTILQECHTTFSAVTRFLCKVSWTCDTKRSEVERYRGLLRKCSSEILALSGDFSRYAEWVREFIMVMTMIISQGDDDGALPFTVATTNEALNSAASTESRLHKIQTSLLLLLTEIEALEGFIWKRPMWKYESPIPGPPSDDFVELIAAKVRDWGLDRRPEEREYCDSPHFPGRLERLCVHWERDAFLNIWLLPDGNRWM